jgi:hypothetical protein
MSLWGLRHTTIVWPREAEVLSGWSPDTYGGLLGETGRVQSMVWGCSTTNRDCSIWLMVNEGSLGGFLPFPPPGGSLYRQ